MNNTLIYYSIVIKLFVFQIACFLYTIYITIIIIINYYIIKVFHILRYFLSKLAAKVSTYNIWLFPVVQLFIYDLLCLLLFNFNVGGQAVSMHVGDCIRVKSTDVQWQMFILL